jgi:hypothetical protein
MGEVFEANAQHFLHPDLEAGQAAVTGNLAAHKGKLARELIEERGASRSTYPFTAGPRSDR